MSTATEETTPAEVHDDHGEFTTTTTSTTITNMA